jgi:hypothetical protein
VTGRAPGYHAGHGAVAVWEFIHRVSLIPAYIRRSKNGRLARSTLALDLDRSEKVALSYALGQAVTGIFCRRLLGVDFLMHVDRYADRFGLRFSSGRKRADLFGRGRGGWVVAEAKGRSNSMEANLRRQLVGQKRSIVSIGGERPWLALGCVASFPPEGRRLRIDAFDPEEEEDIEPIALEGVTLDRFIAAYYEPFIAAVGAGQIEQDDDHMVTAVFGSLGLRVGISRRVAQKIQQANQSSVRGLYESVLVTLEEERNLPGFGDGTLVETNWEVHITTDDWQN